MKFTAKEDFRVGRTLYEEGNTYESTKYDLTDGDVTAFYTAGWVEVEGKEPAPARKPGAQAVKVEKANHG